jgi:hypothetical protein
MSKDRRVEAVLITNAAPSFSTEQHQRSRRYTILMAVHLISFALAGVLYYYAWWLGLVLLVLTTPLPWVAVVLANSPSRPRRRASPPVDHAQLPSLDHDCLPHAAAQKHGTQRGPSGQRADWH